MAILGLCFVKIASNTPQEQQRNWQFGIGMIGKMAKILTASEKTRFITFKATPVVARKFGQYGTLITYDDVRFTLYVDRDCDFLWVKGQIEKA
jgi:hypothetical protein